MFTYSFINLFYVSENDKDLELIPTKIKEQLSALKKITKIKEIFFVKFLTTCLEYYNNK